MYELGKISRGRGGKMVGGEEGVARDICELVRELAIATAAFKLIQTRSPGFESWWDLQKRDLISFLLFQAFHMIYKIKVL